MDVPPKGRGSLVLMHSFMIQLPRLKTKLLCWLDFYDDETPLYPICKFNPLRFPFLSLPDDIKTLLSLLRLYTSQRFRLHQTHASCYSEKLPALPWTPGLIAHGLQISEIDTNQIEGKIPYDEYDLQVI
jgi:hypothetical protein